MRDTEKYALVGVSAFLLAELVSMGVDEVVDAIYRSIDRYGRRQLAKQYTLLGELGS